MVEKRHNQLWDQVFHYLYHYPWFPEEKLVLVIGRQKVELLSTAVADMFRAWNWSAMDLDFFDKEADLQIDLNQPFIIEEELHLVFDIGVIEHIANTQQCLENYMNSLAIGGLLFILTPIKGFYNHGLHTLSEEYLLETMKVNNCAIQKIWYMAADGTLTKDADDVYIAVIGKMTEQFNRPIKHIQQRIYESNISIS